MAQGHSDQHSSGEMLIRKRLQILEQVKEFALLVDITLVRLKQKKVNVITRVSWRWLEIKNEVESVLQICAATSSGMKFSQIKKIHLHFRHLGVRQTTYYVRKITPSTTRNVIRSVIRSCLECQSIDPAPIQWQRGKLGTASVRQRLGMDITHYLNLIDWAFLSCHLVAFSVKRFCCYNPVSHSNLS